MDKIIESIVFFGFGIIVLVGSCIIDAPLSIIVLGGLGTLAGLIFLIMSIVEYKKK